MIVLHRPKDVDTASALALIQEEELSQGRSRASTKEFGKGAWKTGQDKLKFGEPVKGVQQLQKHETEDKLLALKEFRRKNGLCFKCGNKCALGHKCPQQVPLHVIEEILDALEVTEGSKEVDQEELEEETVLALGHSVHSSTPVRRRTLKLCGRIGKLEVLILVDSGSVGTFVSEQLATKLQVALTDCQPTQLMAADGSPMICSKQVKDL